MGRQGVPLLLAPNVSVQGVEGSTAPVLLQRVRMAMLGDQITSDPLQSHEGRFRAFPCVSSFLSSRCSNRSLPTSHFLFASMTQLSLIFQLLCLSLVSVSTSIPPSLTKRATTPEPTACGDVVNSEGTQASELDSLCLKLRPFRRCHHSDISIRMSHIRPIRSSSCHPVYEILL